MSEEISAASSNTQEPEPAGTSQHATVDAHDADKADSNRHRAQPSVTLTVPGQNQGVALQGALHASPTELQSPAEEFPQMLRSPSRPLSAGSGSVVVPVDDKQSQMRSRWERSIDKHLGAVDEYDRVGVLIVRWSDELDDLNTREECSELKKLFQDEFHYDTKLVELTNVQSPHNQLQMATLELVREYDLPSEKNLIIFYYSGHGQFNDDRDLFYLAPSKDDKPCTAATPHPALACWNVVETTLLQSNTDVLTIFDTCLASNLVKAEPYLRAGGTYEHMCGSGMDRDTPRPGTKSFTFDLIKVMKELIVQQSGQSGYFTTNYLAQKLWRIREHGRIPLTWHRHDDADAQHIRLGPKRQPQELNHAPVEPKKEGSRLTLVFDLDKPELNDQDIEKFSKEIAQACRKNLPFKVRRIDWRDFKRRKDPRQQLMDATDFVRKTTNVMRRFSRASSIGDYDASVSPVSAHRVPHSDVDAYHSVGGVPKRKLSATSSYYDGARPRPTSRHHGSHSSHGEPREKGHHLHA